MLRLLVINSLIIIFFSSCSSYKTDSQIILKKEIDRPFLIDTSLQKVHFNFKLNNYLKSYLLKKSKGNTLFKDEDPNLLTKQLDSKLSIVGDKKAIPFNFEKQGDRLSNISKNRLYLSNPVFFENSDSAIIAVSSGVINSMDSSIHLYKKVSNEWILDSTFESWIE